MELIIELSPLVIAIGLLLAIMRPWDLD